MKTKTEILFLESTKSAWDKIQANEELKQCIFDAMEEYASQSEPTPQEQPVPLDLKWDDVLNEFYIEYDSEISNGKLSGKMVLVLKDWLIKNYQVPNPVYLSQREAKHEPAVITPEQVLITTCSLSEYEVYSNPHLTKINLNEAINAMAEYHRLHSKSIDLKALYTELENDAYNVDTCTYEVKQTNQIIRKYFEVSSREIDWKVLRDKYFNECVSKDQTCMHEYAPHDLFEWFKSEIVKQLK